MFNLFKWRCHLHFKPYNPPDNLEIGVIDVMISNIIIWAYFSINFAKYRPEIFIKPINYDLKFLYKYYNLAIIYCVFFIFNMEVG